MNDGAKFKGVVITNAQDAMDAYRAARDRAEAVEAELREAVEFLRPIITSARYESSAVYVVRIPDDTVHQARAMLAAHEDSTSE